MNPPILVTGATGYVGGRLWRLLEADGRREVLEGDPEKAIRVVSEEAFQL